MDSLILAAAVAFAVWFALRRARAVRARRAQQASAAAAPADGQKAMPRIGTPGTVTRDQMKALRECNFEPSPQWSREEAQLILDAVAYLRGVIAITTGDRDAPLEVQNKILAMLLGEGELRERVIDWSRNLTREDRADIEAAIPRDALFDQVQGIVRQLWEDDART
jgi:hypothetical protein